ncbi:unnamed protein product [Gadus morhua 'NCC']
MFTWGSMKFDMLMQQVSRRLLKPSTWVPNREWQPLELGVVGAVKEHPKMANLQKEPACKITGALNSATAMLESMVDESLIQSTPDIVTRQTVFPFNLVTSNVIFSELNTQLGNERRRAARPRDPGAPDRFLQSHLGPNKSQDQPASSQPQDQPASSQPQDQPANSQPQDQPASSQPQDHPVSSQDQPASSQPQDQPASSQPQEQPASSQPQEQPASSQPQEQPASSQM